MTQTEFPPPPPTVHLRAPPPFPASAADSLFGLLGRLSRSAVLYFLFRPSSGISGVESVICAPYFPPPPLPVLQHVATFLRSNPPPAFSSDKTLSSPSLDRYPCRVEPDPLPVVAFFFSPRTLGFKHPPLASTYVQLCPHTIHPFF